LHIKQSIIPLNALASEECLSTACITEPVLWMDIDNAGQVDNGRQKE